MAEQESNQSDSGKHVQLMLAELAAGNPLPTDRLDDLKQLGIYLGKLHLITSRIPHPNQRILDRFLQETDFLESPEAKKVCEREQSRLQAADEKPGSYGVGQSVLHSSKLLAVLVKISSLVADQAKASEVNLTKNNPNPSDLVANKVLERLQSLSYYTGAVRHTLTQPHARQHAQPNAQAPQVSMVGSETKKTISKSGSNQNSKKRGKRRPPGPSKADARPRTQRVGSLHSKTFDPVISEQTRDK